MAGEPNPGPVIALATCAEYANLSGDERMILPHLEALGMAARPLVWDQDPIPTDCRAVVLRSCWDYDRKEPAFRRWLDKLESCGRLVLNAPSVCRWNLDKAYLGELARRGAGLPATAWLPAGLAPDLGSVLAGLGAQEAVIKPAVSMLGNDTWRVTRQGAPDRQGDLEALVHRRPVMVQEYLPEVESQGELSLVFFAGRFSHAVRKLPRQGEFRVHEEHGGTRRAYQPSLACVEEAERILSLVPGTEGLLFARVDLIPRKDQWLLMELELIDPSFYLECCPQAAERFAIALLEALG